MLGALAAREREGREAPQINEGRIAAATKTGLRKMLSKERLAAEMARGEGLSWLDVRVLLADAVPAHAAQGARLDRDPLGRRRPVKHQSCGGVDLALPSIVLSAIKLSPSR